MGLYTGASTTVVPNHGGSNRVTIPASPFQIRGGTGTGGATSVPCKGCYIIALSGTSNIRVRIDAACTTTTGIPVPEHQLANGLRYPLRLDIDDLNRLYFIGDTENDVVDILYWA